MMQKIEILYQDADYLIVNKPAGILTIPDRFDSNIINVTTELKKQFASIFTVHRIDRYTSGVLCFAKNEVAHKHLNAQFEHHTLQKTYLALVHGNAPDDGTIDYKIMEDPSKPGRMEASEKHGKPALTKFKTLQQFGNISLVEIYPETGRTHQIRVHFLAIGHPLLIDEMYGSPEPFLLSSVKRKYKLSKFQEAENPLMQRLTLHASKIEFKHIVDEKTISITAPLPKDFAAVIKQLEKL
jgi:23S rRNA pseudouridine955/2504/2580 synthase/23S rRNA pseudouridine1911/1915/1917 synthase